MTDKHTDRVCLNYREIAASTSRLICNSGGVSSCDDSRYFCCCCCYYYYHYYYYCRSSSSGSGSGSERWKSGVWVFAVALLSQVDSRLAAPYNLGSGSWLAWANDNTMHCVSDSEQLDPQCSTTDIPPPQSATLGLHLISWSLPIWLRVGGWVGLSTQWLKLTACWML